MYLREYAAKSAKLTRWALGLQEFMHADSNIFHTVRPYLCPSQAGIVSKPLNEPSWFLARRLPPTYPTLCYKESWVSPKLGYFPLGLCPKLRT